MSSFKEEHSPIRITSDRSPEYDYAEDALSGNSTVPPSPDKRPSTVSGAPSQKSKQSSRRKCATSMNFMQSFDNNKTGSEMRVSNTRKLPYGYIVNNIKMKQKLSKENFSATQPVHPLKS